MNLNCWESVLAGKFQQQTGGEDMVKGDREPEGGLAVHS
jgi:hypothetical protein